MEFFITDSTTTTARTTSAAATALETTTTPLTTTVVNNTLINVNPIEVVADLCWGTILWAFTNVILFICILGGNALTIIAVRTCRRLRCLISNMFICSLAVSDFIVGLSLPYHLAFYLGSNWGRVHGLCLVRFFLIIFACCVSILTLISISIDRYIAIVYPLHYRRYMTRRVAIFIIACNWLVGATVAVVPMFWNNWSTAYQCEFDEVLPPWYVAGLITPGFMIIWMLMLFMYWRIMKEASKQAKQLNNTRERGKRSNYLQPDWKSVQIVVFIMGCFSICWLPYFIVACSQIFKIYNITPLLYKATFSLAMTNSALNPVIYAWKNSNFRKAFIRLLHCKSPNCYQAAPEFSKESPMSQKRCSSNDSPMVNKRCSISSADIPINHNVDECATSGADVEVGVINGLPLQVQTERLPKIYTVSMSTTSDCLSLH